MILTKTVEVRGKTLNVEDLNPNSGKKVDVQCPACKQIRRVHYRSLVKAGHHICQKCRMNQERGVRLEQGSRYGMVTVLKASKQVGCSIGKCDCGTVREFDNWNLRSGKTKSCGCLRSLNFENVTHLKGEDHWNWKGGITPERASLSASKEYKSWRKDVFDRDFWKCVYCSNDRNIQTHHLVPFSEDRAKVMALDNGVTLCPKCHRAFHSRYGRKNNTIAQFNEFLNERRYQK